MGRTLFIDIAVKILKAYTTVSAIKYNIIDNKKDNNIIVDVVAMPVLQ